MAVGEIMVILKGSNRQKEAMVEKYGVDNAFKLQCFSKNGTQKNKKKLETCFEKYGSNWVPKPDNFDPNVEKRKQTCLERYGVELTICKVNKKKQYSKIRNGKIRETKRNNGTYKHIKNQKIFKILTEKYNVEATIQF